MKLLLVLFVITATLMVANARISFRDLLTMYDMSKDDTVQMATQALYIPMTLKQCTNAICDQVCKALGFHHGVCVSTTTCSCT